MSEALTPHARCKPLPGADQVVGVVRDYNFATPLEVTGVVERLFEAVFMIGEDHMAVRSTAQPSATVGRLTAW